MKSLKTGIIYKTAATTEEFENGKTLFREYAASLDFDLSFQDFANELKTIDQQYNKPKGTLLLAYHEKYPVGCAGIRELEPETAELKRMYVRAAYRGCRIGRKLLEYSINTAKAFGYRKIRLDTIASMTSAQKLYYAYGFYTIPPYRFNPVQGAVYMEKNI